MTKNRIGECPLCKRKDIMLTFHHLIPKTHHKNKWFKKNFTSEELNSGIDICRDCHDAIHKFYDEKTLGKEFNTLEKIQEDEKLSKHFSWVSKQKY